MTIQDIQQLAERHDLHLNDDLQFNEMGIDFRVGFATDHQGNKWVLRVPRRADLLEQIETEKRILQLVKQYLTVQVPEWEVATHELVAYRLLKDKPALTFDSESYEVTWNIDQQSPDYLTSLAKTLVELHRIPEEQVIASGLKIMKPDDLRPEISNRLQIVKSELGISEALEIRYRKWLDNDRLWPDFTSFVHGDLYAGHILTTNQGLITGIIDWTTGQISDPAMDFSGHVSIFGEESLKQLIRNYEMNGGHIWETLFDQAVERAAAAPLAYGFFAVETQDEKHIVGAKAMLNPD